MRKNIVLIGSADSGKKEVGKALSERLGYKVLTAEEEQSDDNSSSQGDKKADREGACMTDLEGAGIAVDKTAEKFIRSSYSIIYSEAKVLERYSDIKEVKENTFVVFIDRASETLDNGVPKVNTEEFELNRKHCDLHLKYKNNSEEIVDYITYLLR